MITKETLLKYADDIWHARGSYIEEPPIYSILLIENPNKEAMFDRNGELVPSGFPDTGDRYEVGFYYHLDDAIDVLMNNRCDIHENCYNAAFILCKFEGLYPGTPTNGRMYFVWDAVIGQGYKQQEEPSIFHHVAF